MTTLTTLSFLATAFVQIEKNLLARDYKHNRRHSSQDQQRPRHKLPLILRKIATANLLHLPKGNPLCNFLCITMRLPRNNGTNWKILQL